MKTCIAFLSKDRVELSRQSVQPLFDGACAQLFHLLWCDGSETEAGEKLAWEIGYPTARCHWNVRGGAGAAIVFALTEMLNSTENYDVVGLVENDVLVLDGGISRVLELFERGATDGLCVGAVSPRCFEDRILIQRDGYAVVHNIGAGCTLLSRDAARLVLDNFRTGWTTDNRRIFATLSGIDIGPYWAFRGAQHQLVADWHWDAVLAAHGLASLALTPSLVEMIGQVPSLEEQGLTLASTHLIQFDSVAVFETYKEHLGAIRVGEHKLDIEIEFYRDDGGTTTIFAHQVGRLGGHYSGDWKLKEVRGFGTFAWEAEESPEMRVSGIMPAFSTGNYPTLVVPLLGTAIFLVSGGKGGGQVRIEDAATGFSETVDLLPENEHTQVMAVQVPAGCQYRDVTLTMLTPGCRFYAVQTREPQMRRTGWQFDHSVLPKP